MVTHSVLFGPVVILPPSPDRAASLVITPAVVTRCSSFVLGEGSHSAPSGPAPIAEPNAAGSAYSLTAPAVVIRSIVFWSAAPHSAPSGPAAIRPGATVRGPSCGIATYDTAPPVVSLPTRALAGSVNHKLPS